jgi:hypothetical protein
VQFYLSEWYIDPRGLSPELAQLCHRINAPPHGAVRDQLIENFMQLIDTVTSSMNIEEDKSSS